MKVASGHIGINVTNLDRSVDFYTGVFGLVRTGGSTGDGRRYAFLGDGERLVLTLWEQSSGRFDARMPGLHHLSFELPSMEEVARAGERLRGQGVRFLYEGLVPHAMGRESGGIFFEDPDGTRLELYAVSGAGGLEAPFVDAPSCGFF